MSIVVPARNCSIYLGEQLRALTLQDFDGEFEIIVSDDASEDDTRSVAQEWSKRCPYIRLIHCGRRGGANEARNRGYRESSGDLLLFCDGDDRAHQGWVTSMTQAAAEADLVAGSLEYGALNPNAHRWLREPQFQTHPAKAFGYRPYAAGGNCGVWRDVIEVVGGWNPAYQEGANDIEFSLRAQRAGYRLAFEPRGIMHYRLKSSGKEAFRQHVAQGLGQARLFADFRDLGMTRAPLTLALAHWVWLILTGPIAVFLPHRRQMWLRRVGIRLGRLKGSARFRVLVL